MNRLCFALACLALSACADLTAPSGASRSSAGDSPAGAKPAAPSPAEPAADPKARLNKVRASHVLVAYQGAARSQATRAKDEAKKLAEGLLNRLRNGGAKFEDVAKEHSDDPSAKTRGGDLGAFDRFTMTKPFADAAFGLDVGQLSGVVETEFGFHIIKRTE
ncbi:MAG: peptidyl-prolyl cis-trans isomerase [Polyangiaceae bacterium]|nr:peptidyl-prolyl cis-trans isomerase [Polyangiaceae bacterium]